MRRIKMRTITIFTLAFVFSLSLISAQIIWDDTTTTVNTLGGNPCGEPHDSWNIHPPAKYFTIPKGDEKVFECRSPFSGIDSCCPSGFSCRQVGPSLGILPLPGYAIDANSFTCLVSSEKYCSDFKTKSACENESTVSHAKESIESIPGKSKGFCSSVAGWKNSAGEDCINRTSCSCIWNSANSSCVARHYATQNCSGIAVPIPTPADCSWKIVDDNGCNLGKEMMHVIWQYVEGDGISNCGEYFEDDISCGAAVKLNFFTLINIIAAILIIGVIYYIYSNRKKKTAGKKAVKKKRARKSD